MSSESYVRVLLALAPLVVCLAFSLEDDWWTRPRAIGCLTAAVLFGCSVWGGGFGVWGALPWLFLTAGRAFSAARELAGVSWGQTADMARLAAFLFLPVGCVWALFDQLGYQPLGFSGIIVLLTGIHFHYAGFALPRLTGLWLQSEPRGPVFKWATWGVIAGVPLVAIGITTSQLGLPDWVEVLCVSVLAASALVVSLAQLEWAFRAPLPLLARLMFALGGLALASGMVLAVLYGWRSLFPMAWLSIPAMIATHGTLNSLGFCLPGLVAWKVHLSERKKSQNI